MNFSYSTRDVYLFVYVSIFRKFWIFLSQATLFDKITVFSVVNIILVRTVIKCIKAHIMRGSFITLFLDKIMTFNIISCSNCFYYIFGTSPFWNELLTFWLCSPFFNTVLLCGVFEYAYDKPLICEIPQKSFLDIEWGFENQNKWSFLLGVDLKVYILGITAVWVR